MNVYFSQMQALEAVYKEAGFQRAADKLFITQSAISQRIRAFENSVGQPLLIRTTPPTLTNLGVIVDLRTRMVDRAWTWTD